MQKMIRQMLITILLLLFTVLLFEYTDIDIWIQDKLYNFEIKLWVLDRNDKLTKFIFYDGIKKLYFAFVVLIIFSLLFFRKNQLLLRYKQGLLIVLLSSLLIPLVVGVLKATTNTPCPKHIQHYNGNYPYVTVLKKYPPDFYQRNKVKCYPAGHSSGGFALLSLYFLFIKRRNKIVALISAISVGWSIGIYKMMIGDHFFSHTVVTMLLAWLISLIIAEQINGKFYLYHKLVSYFKPKNKLYEI